MGGHHKIEKMKMKGEFDMKLGGFGQMLLAAGAGLAAYVLWVTYSNSQKEKKDRYESEGKAPNHHDQTETHDGMNMSDVVTMIMHHQSHIDNLRETVESNHRFPKPNPWQKLPEKEIVRTLNAPQAIGPYAQAIKYNGMVFTSGQIALTATGELKAHTIQQQS